MHKAPSANPLLAGDNRLLSRWRCLGWSWLGIWALALGIGGCNSQSALAAQDAAFRQVRIKANERVDGLIPDKDAGWVECGIQRARQAEQRTTGQTNMLSVWYVRGLDQNLQTRWEHRGSVRGINRAMGVFALPDGRYTAVMVEGVPAPDSGPKPTVNHRLVVITFAATGAIQSRTSYEAGTAEGLLRGCQLLGDETIVLFGTGPVGRTELGTVVGGSYDGPFIVGLNPESKVVRFLVGTNLSAGLQFGLQPFRQGGELVIPARERSDRARSAVTNKVGGRLAMRSSVLTLRTAGTSAVLTEQSVNLPNSRVGLAAPVGAGEMILSWRDEARFSPALVMQVSQPGGWVVGNAEFLGRASAEGKLRWAKEFSGGIAAVRGVVPSSEGGVCVLVESSGNSTGLDGERLPAASERRLNVIRLSREGQVLTKWIVCGGEDRDWIPSNRNFAIQPRRLLVSLEATGRLITGLPGETKETTLLERSSVLLSTELK